MSRNNFGHNVFHQVWETSGDFVVFQPPTKPIDPVLRDETRKDRFQDPAYNTNIVAKGQLPSGVNVGHVVDGDFIATGTHQPLRMASGGVLINDHIRPKHAPLLFQQSNFAQAPDDFKLPSNYALDMRNNTHADGTLNLNSTSRAEKKRRTLRQKAIKRKERIQSQLESLKNAGFDMKDSEFKELTDELKELNNTINPAMIVQEAILQAQKNAEEQAVKIAGEEKALAEQRNIALLKILKENRDAMKAIAGGMGLPAIGAGGGGGGGGAGGGGGGGAGAPASGAGGGGGGGGGGVLITEISKSENFLRGDVKAMIGKRANLNETLDHLNSLKLNLPKNEYDDIYRNVIERISATLIPEADRISFNPEKGVLSITEGKMDFSKLDPINVGVFVNTMVAYNVTLPLREKAMLSSKTSIDDLRGFPLKKKGRSNYEISGKPDDLNKMLDTEFIEFIDMIKKDEIKSVDGLTNYSTTTNSAKKAGNIVKNFPKKFLTDDYEKFKEEVLVPWLRSKTMITADIFTKYVYPHIKPERLPPTFSPEPPEPKTPASGSGRGSP